MEKGQDENIILANGPCSGEQTGFQRDRLLLLERLCFHV